MKARNLFILITLCSFNILAQDFEWVTSSGGTSHDYGNSIALDGQGNIYITGSFGTTADFDPGPGTFNLITNGGDDIFIQKLAADGSLVWAKSVGGIFPDYGRSIATDAAGNVYVTGYFNTTADFDPGPGVYTVNAAINTGAFVLKLDSNGDFVWAKSTGGRDSYSVTIDPSGNVYTTGYFNNTQDFDPGPGVYNMTDVGNGDLYIQKLNAAGNFIWAKQMGGGLPDISKYITTDAAGNVYSTGRFQVTADFDPGAGTFNLTSNGVEDVYVQKLDPAGNFIWARSIGSTGADFGESVAVDLAGNVYLTGYFRYTVDFDPGVDTFELTANGTLEDIFIQKLDVNGNLIWAYILGSSVDDRGASIIVDPMGDIYTTGFFQNTIDFDRTAGVHNLTTSAPGRNPFIQKIDSGGNLLWVRSIEDDYFTGIAADSSGAVWLGGWYSNTGDFDPGVATFDMSSVSGSVDNFVLKLSPCAPKSGLDVMTVCDSHTWIDGNTYSASNNTAQHTLVGASASGCDSVVHLDLTILNSGMYTDTRTECSSLLWIDGNTYTSTNNTATHTVVGGASNGCDSITSLDLTILGPVISITATTSMLTANAIGASYQWLDCNKNYIAIGGETNPSFTPSVNGDYAVEVTQNSCIDTSVCINITKAGIVTLGLFSRVSIFPNPNQGFVNIELPDLDDASIKLYSAMGQLIYYKENVRSSVHRFELNEAAGLYFIEISSAGYSKHYKIVKE